MKKKYSLTVELMHDMYDDRKGDRRNVEAETPYKLGEMWNASEKVVEVRVFNEGECPTCGQKIRYYKD